MRVYWDENKTTRTARPELLQRRSCRALRMVGNSTKFLFVTFSRDGTDQQVQAILQKMINDGIRLPDETSLYTFLGYTESNLKSGQVIFFQEDDVWTCQNILKALGDLDDVFLKYGPGKYAARLGLSFSSTVDTINVPRKQALLIADRETSDCSLATDGCGMIRESQAIIIRKQLNLKTNTSVFLVRFGGVKGLLVAYPDSQFEKQCRHICKRMNKSDQQFDDLSEYKLAYRYSMLKYHNGPDIVEVHSYSSSAPSASLNHAFVVLLLSLNVPLQVHVPFKDLLLEHLHSIDDILNDRETALKYINGELDAKGDAFYQDVFEMLQAGFDLDEPHLLEVLKRYQQMQYNNLRKKLSIRVKACYSKMHHFFDELGILGENEVYINLPDRDGVCTSKVLVARNPASFPSDMRVLQAVNKPELSFLTNCIVFSRRSGYSIPDTMGGGDLDGDKYFVCWDQTIIPRQTQTPETRSSPPTSLASKSRKLEDLNTCLVHNFMKLRYHKLVGTISNEWTKAVEESPDMALANAPYPRRIAKLKEAALDLVKTDEDPQNLWKEFKALQKTFSPVARDEAQPGDRPLDELRKLVPEVPDTTSPKPAVLQADAELNLRKKVMLAFNSELSKAIAKDRADSVANSDIVSRSSTCIETCVDKVRKAYLTKYFPSCGIISDENRQAYIRASAWYHVGYESGKPAFAWLGGRRLCHIKAASTNGGRPGFVIGSLKRKPLDEQ
ncbi:hypothetical protein EW145_g7507 [Phellinidium pouzarii]|uniref:RNA-dependent RNA polymerase n=1 Tax=Phellinidium pouzarii TaxID=167371 RepID=A0A4S4KJX5_9AGAM|nr:hypothetical protein EW145_g7507 [Phellinidium pouzarii]